MNKCFPGSTFKNSVQFTKYLTTFISIEVFLLFLFFILVLYDSLNIQFHFETSNKTALTLLMIAIIFQWFIHILVYFLLFFAVLITIMKLMWIYKINFNTHQLGIPNLSYSPKSAVGWSLVPFMIYYPMREICKSNWYASDQWRNQPAPTLFKMWWATILLWVFIKTFFMVYYFYTTDTLIFISTSRSSSGFLLSNSLIITSEILFIILIKKISKKQIIEKAAFGKNL